MKKVLLLVLFGCFGFCKGASEQREGRFVIVQYNKRQAQVFAELWQDWSEFAAQAVNSFEVQNDYDWAVAKVRDQSEEAQMRGIITQQQLDELECHLELVPSRFLPSKSAGKTQ